MTQAELTRMLHYNPNSGVFTWRASSRRGWNGKRAGWVDEQGYLYIKIAGTLRPAHRLAWLYMTGAWPPSGYIDHIDTDPSNNRWENLRDATKRTNQENRRRPGRRNKAGFLGVSPNGDRWSASIVSHRNKHHLGTFDTPQEAHVAYVAAKRQLHKGNTL